MIPQQARRRLQEVSRTLRPRAGGVANARDAVLLDQRRGDERSSAALLQARALGPDSWLPLHDEPIYPVLPAPHGALLWTSEADLVAQLAAFVAGGVAEGQQCLLITSAAHRAGVRRRLALWGVVPVQVLELDADELLERLVGPSGLDTAAFEVLVGDVARAAAGGPGGVRAFGEMAGLLAERGDAAASRELEHAWLALASSVVLPLLCSYRLSGSPADDDLRRLVDATHSHRVAAPGQVSCQGGGTPVR